MVRIVQVGAGSGGMPVLDLVCRDERIAAVTIIEPDIYKPHNVHRHFFATTDVGQRKGDLARRWLLERRPDLDVTILPVNLFDTGAAAAIDHAVAEADLGICAADTETAKFHWDALMRRHAKPWTLGEVLSGGIGGFVHWFVPDGPCYGCVASHLQRNVTVDKPSTPDYSQPGGPVPETTIPASKASISVIAGLHAQLTLQMLEQGSDFQPGFTSMLFTLKKVSDVFEEAFKPFRFRVQKSPACLICGVAGDAENLDAALEQALERLKGRA